MRLAQGRRFGGSLQQIELSFQLNQAFSRGFSRIMSKSAKRRKKTICLLALNRHFQFQDMFPSVSFSCTLKDFVPERVAKTVLTKLCENAKPTSQIQTRKLLRSQHHSVEIKI